MGRPRVQPSQRRRALEACDPCRRAKRRCRHWTVPTSPPQPSASTLSQSRDTAEASSELSIVPSSRDSDTGHPSPQGPRSRMLLNLRVYIGGAASISFLQVVRKMVADQIGPSQFSHNAQNDSMLEKESPTSMTVIPEGSLTDLNDKSKLLYAQCYYAVTEGFMDIFSPSEVEKHFILPHVSCSPQRGAVFDMVIALGAQCKSDESARDVGQRYFVQAQAQAFAGLLEHADIDVVRSFLLMAFYLLGDCRRNAAFMYLGIATRAAVALGLHSQDSYQDLTGSVQNMRLRVWTSLSIVDTLVNSILGRPAATAGLKGNIRAVIDSLPPNTITDSTARLMASHQVVTLINDVVELLYERRDVSIATIEGLLHELQIWSRNLPVRLRFAGASSPKRDPGALGNIHVSCLYYFAVMLATRPVLIATLITTPTQHALPESQLASACLDAAVYLVQTCVDAKRLSLLFGNMCIMKALVFAAGLVLGFDMFAKRASDPDVESAFTGAGDVLAHLSSQSPQAAHYHDILTHLSTAITKQRQNASARRSHYVSRILTLHEHSDGAADAQPADESADVFLGWDSLDVSQWDSFPFSPVTCSL